MSSSASSTLHGVEVDLSEANVELNYYTMPHFTKSKFWT